MPAATATLLEDSSVNIDQWLAGEVDQVFAEQEGIAFVTQNRQFCFERQKIVADHWRTGR